LQLLAREFAAFNVRLAEISKERPTVPISGVSRFKIAPRDRSTDTSLRKDQGWHRMDVHRLITVDSMGST
jgi:hypothetical protein